MPPLYFANAYMRLLYRFMQLTPAQEPAFFANTGLDAAQLLDARLEVPFAAQMQVCRNALALSEPGLGLRIGGQLQLAAHGALGTAMQNAENLRQALQTFARFSAVRASFFSLEIAGSGDTCRLWLQLDRLDGDLVPFFTESILSTLHHCVAFHSGASEPFTALSLVYPVPDHAGDYQRTLGISAEFGAADTCVSFPAAYLALATHDPDPVVFAEYVARCRLEMDSRGAANDTATAIEQFLWGNPGKLWRAEELADVLGVSSRTLLRRLQAESTSYQALRDAVLQRQAASFLATLSVADTAATLGFADESSFRRSFKRWFGVPPADFRRRPAVRA